MRAIPALLCLASGVAAQASWTAVLAPTSPSPRTEVTLDSDGGGALLFGGQYGPGVAAYNELWRFDGATWTQLTTSGPAPQPRSRHAACFDPVRGKLVVFGGDAQYFNGAGAGVPLGDTWEWDVATSTWALMAPLTSPTARVHPRMAFDPVNLKPLLFGGRGAGSNQTWQWDGTDWTQLAPATVPPGREQTHLATDWARGRVWMFGGSVGATAGPLADTWFWNGTDWTQVTTATLPGGGGIRNGRMVRDELRDRLVVYGGAWAVGGFGTSTWEFNGVDWAARSLAPTPTGRTGLGMAYVPTLARTVLFGGFSAATNVVGDVWTLQTNAPAGVATTTAGCTSSAGAPLLNATAPWAGDTVQFSVANTALTAIPMLALGLANPGLPLAFLGAPNCVLAAHTDVLAVAFGPVALPLPNDPSLAGAQLFAQGIGLEFLLAGGFRIALSDGVRLTVGVR
jgi:hypothetical protein